MKGTVIWFNSNAGFGFAKAADGSEVYLKFENLGDSVFYLGTGEEIEFDIEVVGNQKIAKKIRLLFCSTSTT
jgi:cold shock CspA family protein